MALLKLVLTAALAGICAAGDAQAYDRVASLGESPFASAFDDTGNHGTMVDLIGALDRVTQSSTEIVLRPFARSLQETAEGHADFHLPFIQADDVPAPEGLAYVMDVDFGPVAFVIYSRKQAAFDAQTVAKASSIDVEPGHERFFPFPVEVTHCVRCSLDSLLEARTDALILSDDVVDPLLADAKYKEIHRALYKFFPVRALVPANADSSATRRYLIEGVRRLKATGEFARITGNNRKYSDWQP